MNVTLGKNNTCSFNFLLSSYLLQIFSSCYCWPLALFLVTSSELGLDYVQYCGSILRRSTTDLPLWFRNKYVGFYYKSSECPSSFCDINSFCFCRLGNDDNQFETSMANSGCEVHRFDPSIKSAHIQEGRHLWYHRLSVDWRDPNPAIAAHKLHSNTKKLGTILNEFGHQKVRTRGSGFWLRD